MIYLQLREVVVQEHTGCYQARSTIVLAVAIEGVVIGGSERASVKALGAGSQRQ